MADIDGGAPNTVDWDDDDLDGGEPDSEFEASEDGGTPSSSDSSDFPAYAPARPYMQLRNQRRKARRGRR